MVSSFKEEPISLGAVVPCYRVSRQILPVLAAMPSVISKIYVVDDDCPERTGNLVEEKVTDPRVVVLYHDENQGVGGATISGYKRGLSDGISILVKIDGDGQMDPANVMQLAGPILAGQADYTKGNRFFKVKEIGEMPLNRVLGNIALSFMSKLSTGYWNIFDPTNGYTAIHSAVAQELPFESLSKSFFFESDLLYHLNTLGAKVQNVPMAAMYGDGSSSLVVKRIVPEFLYKHARNAFRRIFYNYFLRDFSLASVQLCVGFVLVAFGFGFGVATWREVAVTGINASAGTVMLVALPVLLGIQLILSFLAYDMSCSPEVPIHPMLEMRRGWETDQSLS